MVGVISAVIAVLGAAVTAVLTYRLQTQARSRDRLDYMSRYRDALLWAAFDLQSRLFNILHGFEIDRRPGRQGFTSAYLLEGTERQALYVRRSTAFLFAEYLGWVEVFRRDIQFLDLGKNEVNRQIMLALTTISRTIATSTPPDTACFMIFRTDQRALGELMIEPDSKPGERGCLGYAAFCAKLTDDEAFAKWGHELLDHVEQAARHPGLAQGRLTKLQHQLIDLIDLLDPEGGRFPAAQRSYFEAAGPG
ncbi:hypothetical protein FAF44_25905 [Nonomuraea sp. MG754425]|uniref:hypothetical protein n=1 Tax=Nonomuraea sp. MG754425 TaxID=2570319 RepID=UPI001F321C15|nr:hypothetical protein [Nonomuraea sp. MG754425]MCF6471804.1 hypothetical protein [Nonomuraea sp. MG754425]